MNNNGQMIMLIAVYAAIFAALYFFLIRPNSKKKKQEAELRNNLEIGEYTKMTVSGDKIKINYYNYSPNEDVYFTYLYKTDMTFNM